MIGVPGAGSTPAFLASALPGIDAIFDYRDAPICSLLSWMSAHAPAILVGMSYGAHMCVQHVGQLPTVKGLILIAPAWTDIPDPRYAEHVQALTKQGIHAHLSSLPRQPAWVRTAVTDAWSQFSPTALISHLAEVASTKGPGLTKLRDVNIPTVVVGFWDDPLHTWDVAREWAMAIPTSRLIGMPSMSPERNLRNLTQAAEVNLRDLTRG
jgi:pimeloyl-ACP methyl ester carboxylesterase